MIYEFPPTRGKVVRLRRTEVRHRVLKAAELLFADTTLPCVVLDQSQSGVRVRLTEPVEAPELASLQIGGERIAVRRRWARDVEMGFSVEGVESSAHVAWQLHESLRLTSIRGLIKVMEAQNFFADAGLQADAEAVEAGLRRLESALAAAAVRVSS